MGADELDWTKTPVEKLRALHKMAGWGHDPPAEVNLGPILCSGPGTSWVTLHGYRQDTQLVHTPYIRAWVTGPLHPAHSVIRLLFKARLPDLPPSLRETGNEMPRLLEPSAACTNQSMEPVQM